MAKENYTGATTVKDALLILLQNDLDELFTNVTEVQTARDGEASLLGKIDAVQAYFQALMDAMAVSIAALSAASGVLISSNDIAVGYLNGKLAAGDGISLTEGSDGGNETLTIASIKEYGNEIDKTINYVILAADLPRSGDTLITNRGAGGAINFTLPAGFTGARLIAEVVAAQYLKITAAGTEVISFLGTDTSAGGYIRSDVPGNSVSLYWNGARWVINNITGLWSYDQ